MKQTVANHDVDADAGLATGSLPIAVVIDSEPDGVIGLSPEPWRGFEAGIGMLGDIRREFSDRLGAKVIFNWMIRADRHIEEVYGDAGWAFENFGSQIEALREEGDFLGLHVHPIREVDAVEDYIDEAWTIDTIGSGIDAWERAFGDPPAAVSWSRGWSSSAVLGFLGARGVHVDMSVFPGRDQSAHATGIDVRMDIPDLGDVPQRPYYPSADDWRVPAKVPGTGTWILPYATTAVDAWLHPIEKLGRRLIGRPTRSRVEHNYLFAAYRRGFRAYVDDLVTQPTPYLTLNARSSAFGRRTPEELRRCFLALERVAERHGCEFADPMRIMDRCST